MIAYAELQITSNFSFLRGASHPEELVQQAAALKYSAIAITDRNSFAGIVRAHVEAGKQGIRFIPACRLDLLDGPSLLAFPTDAAAYSRLSTLLTLGNRRAEKGECHLYRADVYAHATGSHFILLPPTVLNAVFDFDDDFKEVLAEYKQVFGKYLSLAVSRRYHGDDAKQLHCLARLSSQHGVPLVATNDVHYHHPERRQLQDIVTCAREKCTIHTAGFRLHANAERYLKPIDEMMRLFRQYPEALTQTQVIADACQFSLHDLTYRYPKEVTRDGLSPQAYLTDLVWEGARMRYPDGVPDKVCEAIANELRFIDEMNYAEYFLTVQDIVKYARDSKILCQGRGSAANSTVCYCLGITSVDPTKFDLLFERFISSARNEPPDIDVDFEHERREEVMQYVYRKYGRDRAAIVATVTQQHHKGAIRDVGKAMGLSVDVINRLAGLIWDFADEGFDRTRIISQGLNPDDATLRKVLELTTQFIGFPRQLGQHTGGFVITDGKLSDLCPILNARMEDRTCIEWNKDDIDALGFLKVDILALGMLTCIRKAFDLLGQHHGRLLDLAAVPQDDAEVYAMISRADTIGVFQIESRAQQSMLPRLRPERFYDLVIEVAIVRPGPIQGDMVHPYLRRRNNEEKVEYPSPELEEILKRTLGVPLFQEQAMKIAIVAAGFTPAEADELRRSMATFKAKGKVSYFEHKLINGMVQKGYSEEYARRVFRQLEGFGSYGFPESHAVSFALLVYVSSWIKCHYPDVFACALLNSMPMGFYQPAQIIIDARNHGVEVRPMDINHSLWDNTLEEKRGKYCVLRLGFRQAKGLREDDMKVLIKNRKQGYASVQALRETGLPETVLENLADADAFRSLGLDRRQALWEVSVKDKPVTIFTGDALQEPAERTVSLPAMRLSEHVVHDYAATSLSLKAHPVSFVRQALDQLRVVPAASLAQAKDGDSVKVAGLVLVRQRPGTASGICFITLEDETGTANLVVFQNLFDTYRKEIIQARLLMVEGQLQREGEVIHVVVRRCHNVSRLLRQLTDTPHEPLSVQMSRADEKSAAYLPKKNLADRAVQGSIFPDGRNFK